MPGSDHHLEFKEQGTVFTEGEPGDSAFIVERGRVELMALISGEAVRIATLHEGDLFGEMVLIDNQLRSATAVADPGTSLIVIPRKYVEEKIDVSDKLVGMLLKVVLERYREMRGRLEHVLLGNDLDDASLVEHADHAYEQDAQYTAERLQAENNLKLAFEAGHLELFYQPIISLRDGHVAGCESLLRWRHPERGMIPPFEFIGLAEETGLIVPIGLWIIEEACQAYRRFSEIASENFSVSVNLSGRQFESEDLVADIKSIFQKTAVSPDRIKLEITESLLMANPLRVAEILQACKGLGTEIAIDDFGTGYSSFSYLHRFPIDTLKIDQSFVFTMRDNPKSLEIVRTLCSLANSLGMSVIAEGIEQGEDAEILQDFDADYGQGYHYAKPMPEAEFIKFLQTWEAGSSQASA